MVEELTAAVPPMGEPRQNPKSRSHRKTNQRDLAGDQAITTVRCTPEVAEIFAGASADANAASREFFILPDIQNNLGAEPRKTKESLVAEYSDLFNRAHKALTVPALSIIYNAQTVFMTVYCNNDAIRVINDARAHSMVTYEPIGLSHLKAANERYCKELRESLIVASQSTPSPCGPT